MRAWILCLPILLSCKPRLPNSYSSSTPTYEFSEYKTVADLCSAFTRGINLAVQDKQFTLPPGTDLSDPTTVQQMHELCVQRLKTEQSVRGVTFADPDSTLNLYQDGMSFFSNKILAGLVGISGGFNSAGNASGFFKSHADGVTVGVDVGVAAGVSGKLAVEVALDRGEVGIFCTPGFGAVTDVSIGTNGNFGLLKCPNLDTYSGAALAFGFGADASMIGMPFDAGISGSVGMNGPALLTALRNYATAKGKANVLQGMRSEGPSFVKDIAAPFSKRGTQEAFFTLLVLTMLKSIDHGANGLGNLGAILAEAIPNLHIETGRLAGVLRNKPATLSLDAKTIISQLRDSTPSDRYPTIRTMLDLIVASSTGCASVTVSFGLSASLSPVQIGTTFWEYQLLGKFHPGDLISVPIHMIESVAHFFGNLFTRGPKAAARELAAEEKRYAHQLMNAGRQIARIFNPGELARSCVLKPARGFYNIFLE